MHCDDAGGLALPLFGVGVEVALAVVVVDGGLLPPDAELTTNDIGPRTERNSEFPPLGNL